MIANSSAEKIAALGAGLLFGFGLALAQMTNPLKVLGFLDIRGTWDPSLAFVLGGAVAVSFLSFRYILRRGQPRFGDRFHVTANRRWLEPQLLLGASLFGIGWGISGYCPGPALAQLAAPNAETWEFLPALIVGALISRVIDRRTARSD
jgi:uncharacterized membrane protein YedE/YeeE